MMLMVSLCDVESACPPTTFLASTISVIDANHCRHWALPHRESRAMRAGFHPLLSLVLNT